MAFPLTAELLSATYDLLLLTPPFRRWKMPASSTIAFSITRSINTRGSATGTDKIDISERNIGRFDTLLPTMAHEMVHVYNHSKGHKRSAHGAEFHRCAALVCKHHGFDPKMF